MPSFTVPDPSLSDLDRLVLAAVAISLVAFADTKPGYGQTLILDHGYGLETWYGHSRKLLVQRGQKVRRGDVIAQLGNSGRSTGPHLHYEVRVGGEAVDPTPYMVDTQLASVDPTLGRGGPE